MIDTTWSDRRAWRGEADAAAIVRPEPEWRLPVASIALTHWEEHCHECAVPHCYVECPVYRARADRRCRRFDYGCVPDSRFRGPYGYGIDLRFGRWAKLETEFHAVSVSPWVAKITDTLSRGVSAVARALWPLVVWATPIRRTTWVTEHARNWLLRQLSRGARPRADLFVIEVYNLQSFDVPLVVQCATGGAVFHRRSITLRSGVNRVEVATRDLGLHGVDKARVSVFPDNDLNARLIFTWLDFVGSRQQPQQTGPDHVAQSAIPAAKVKCIAWDLDNTVWNGVLIEDGADGVALRQEVLDVIKELDGRGIVHTILSKNTHEQAWEALQKFGVHEYFVFPAINWGSKSRNLIQVASRMNIGLDAFAFVDDSPFERDQIAAHLPMVRVFTEKDVPRLPSMEPMFVPVTEMSRQRRLTYLVEMQREAFRASVGGDDLAFLRSCEICASFFKPRTPEETARCLELVQRSNQLNLCARRYTQQEFESLLASGAMECFGIRCADRFGDYGVVGFVSVRKGAEPLIEDLVISCRVAKRRVEHSLIRWLGERYASEGASTLAATLVHTSRNGVLAEVFKDLPCETSGSTEAQTTYRLSSARLHEIPVVINVEEFLM